MGDHSKDEPEYKGNRDKIPEPHPAGEKKDPPYTGWDGEVPSKEGGDKEEDWIHKPPYEWQSEHFKASYTATCFCGNLAFEFVGDPISAKFCHCKDCQSMHGAPFQHAAIYHKTSVRMVKNNENVLDFYSTAIHKSEHHVPAKVHCKNCTSPIFDEGKNTVLSYPSAFKFKDGKLPKAFQGTDHIFYSQRSMDIKDGQPKWEKHKGGALVEETSGEDHLMGGQDGKEGVKKKRKPNEDKTDEK